MLIPWLLVSAQPVEKDLEEPIVVTASRVPQEQSESAASSTVIDRTAIERQGEPMLHSLLRLTPSASVQSSGPLGSFVEVRIRGAEANHTLLFIDGIRANDPAANDTPRFELLNADIASRLEVVRGPQSALWGADAIGGVIAVNGLAPEITSVGGHAEAGSFGFGRMGGSGALVDPAVGLRIAAAAGWQRAKGIDSFDGNGDSDGYRNLAARLRASWNPMPSVELGVAGVRLDGMSDYDGIDLATFRRADTLDSSRNRLSAGRLWLSAGDREQGTSGTVSASLLGSSNRNLLDEAEINRTSGSRRTVAAQLQHRFATGSIEHLAIIAAEHVRERFRASDAIYGGATNQRRERSHEAVTAEWRAELRRLVVDVALRHDSFSSFKDATTLRTSALVRLPASFSLAASYAEGIAQPTFFDLHGFFPGSFVGNPDLRPERSRGFEASLRFRTRTFEAGLTAYRQKLRDEIVDVFDPASFLSSTLNRDRASHRHGIEAEASLRLGKELHLHAHYAYLKATEPGAGASVQLREVRRPRHSGSIALDGTSGRFTYGGSLAFVGKRVDTDFDLFPPRRVRLGSYWLAGARVAYRLRPGLELFARGSNLLDQRYEDVFAYRTEGRALYAGLRLGGD